MKTVLKGILIVATAALGFSPLVAQDKPAAPKASETKQAAVRPPMKPASADAAALLAPPPANDGLVAGAQPIVQANSFESRFSAAK